MKHWIIIACVAFVAVVVIVLAAEYFYILHNGTPVAAPVIPRTSQELGSSGPRLTYVVMGDSTSIGQGTAYDNSYALASAEHLAKDHTVTFVNVGISGATVKTVAQDQLAKAASYKPDVVLLGVGANDATHFTSRSSIQKSLQAIVDGLQAANPSVKIIVTGSPAMDAVRRFPIGAKQIMHLRTYQVNHAFAPIIAKNHLTFAPIADKTRAAFLADKTLTASDHFHPTARGYALWIPVINSALDQTLQTTP